MMAQAPSNIALIKYMGKSEAQGNIAANISLSYTLSHLVTQVEVENSADSDHSWASLDGELCLSSQGQERFLQHWRFLCEELEIPGSYLIRSSNNFPSDCGLASSASSFAALTRAGVELSGKDLSLNQIAALSQKGSGSSCRSFFSPWAVWNGEEAGPWDLGISDLLHQVAVVADGKKKVSSSEAHRRVLTSALYQGRGERAQQRFEKLSSALRDGDWKRAFEITWAEFWDMHALFETSEVPFGYMTEGSLALLNGVRQLWQEMGDGPIVTMDAGPNVHMLYRPDQRQLATVLKKRCGLALNWIQSE